VKNARLSAFSSSIRRDVARVPNVAVKSEFCGEERGAKLGYQLLSGVMTRAEAGLQIAIKARLVPGPVRQLMERHVVEVIGALERCECGHRNEVVARHVTCFAVPLPNVGARTSQEVVGNHVPRVGIAHAHRLAGSDAIGQVVALFDVENRFA
jgi:hypothetical protein